MICNYRTYQPSICCVGATGIRGETEKAPKTDISTPAGEGCNAVGSISIWEKDSHAVPEDIWPIVWPCDALSVLSEPNLATLLL